MKREEEEQHRDFMLQKVISIRYLLRSVDRAFADIEYYIQEHFTKDKIDK